MKILHITPAYVPAYRYGGPIFSVHAINKWLVKLGVEVSVYTTNSNGPEKLNVPLGIPVDIDGVKVFYFPTNFLSRWYYSGVMRKALKGNLKNFDLVHITSVFLFSSMFGARYAKKFDKPYIISPRGNLMSAPLHNSPFKKKIYLSLFERKNLAGADAIHFTAEEEREDYLTAKLPLKTSFIIPNGFDPAEFENGKPATSFREKLKINKSKKIILFLSRINWKKGLDTLIPAFKLVRAKYQDTVLVIAGGDDEGYRKIVERDIEKSGLIIGRDVIFTGMITGMEKKAAYEESDVFVLPSYGENFAMVSVEAMYFGLPVVMTDVVGTASAVRGAGAGLIVKKSDEGVADAIDKILSDARAKETMGAKGKKLVTERYSMDKVARRFAEEYAKIIKK